MTPAEILTDALRHIGLRCENYTAPPFCPDAGRHRDGTDTVSRWCDGCIARVALEQTDRLVAGLLTPLEHQALHLSGQLANAVRRLIGDGTMAADDWNEAAIHLHAVQHAILAQAAGRAYPDKYRLLGGWPEPGGGPAVPPGDRPDAVR